jgi:hypothetical protein
MSLKILHLSDTPWSGAVIRIVRLFNRHTKHEVRHLVWDPVARDRVFETDIASSNLTRDEVEMWLGWADIIHYHGRYRRQAIFSAHKLPVPKKPSVIQMHGPRTSDNYAPELNSGVPLAVVAQYQVRIWPEAKFIVPNVVDITDDAYNMPKPVKMNRIPCVSYAPSNFNCRGWDNKGYGEVAPILKRMNLAGQIVFQLIVNQPHDIALSRKRRADIGIDEVVTGSYHLSSLEYLAMGTPCFAGLDQQTIDVVKNITGCPDNLPWIVSNAGNFQSKLNRIIKERTWPQLGAESRIWMEKYWNPQFLVGCYEKMYEEIM